MGIIEEDAAASESDFLLYRTTFCPYCVAAKRLLDQKGLSYVEISLDNNLTLRREVVEQTGHRTVPVLIDNRDKNPIFIGGFDELSRYLK